MRRAFPPALALCILAVGANAESADTNPARKLTAEQVRFFERRIRPLLVKHCYKCHSARAKDLQAGLRLDWRGGLLKGGESGPAVVPGKPDKSLLIQAVRYKSGDMQMPPDGKLKDREIADLEKWVRIGLPDPRTSAGKSAAHSHAVETPHWAFRAVKKPAVPQVRDAAWPRNPVDRFVLAKLEAAGMQPAPPADKRTLLRRVTFDLIGLPPTPDQIDAFLADDSPDAFEKVVDRLLASQQYGERWGRHWLDVVRYADTTGCNGDFPMPEAYRYRNYVIRSFNRDKPYDEFLREQLAGDLLPAKNDAERFEHVTATGYIAISRRFSSVAEEFHLTLDDTIDNLGKAILGLTIGCARCHSHKFDPIPQSDYYALYGIFDSTRYAFPGTEIYRHTNGLTPLVSRERLKKLQPFLDRMEKLDAEIFRIYSKQAKLDTGKEKNRLKSQWKKLQAERDRLIQKMPKYPAAYGVSEGRPADARIHLKGDPEQPGREVPRRFLTVLGGQKVQHGDKHSGRLQLANWIADPDNPLTARVFVNRVWQHHFGAGLVRTPNDFGSRGEPPTHPGLLDWLTAEFTGELRVESRESGARGRRSEAGGQTSKDGSHGRTVHHSPLTTQPDRNRWSIKRLHRLIVLSQAYRMQCVEKPRYALQDPDNRLLWTFNRRRLSAEEIRDAFLFVSGGLDTSMGGRHPFPPEWKWRYSQHRPFLADYPTARRSVYLMQQRIRQQPYLGTFDGADTNAAVGERKISTTPQQALYLLNDKFIHEQADRFAGRILAGSQTLEQRIAAAFRYTFARSSDPTEIDEARDYLRHLRRAAASAGITPEKQERAAWASYLRVLLSSNEFVFVE